METIDMNSKSKVRSLADWPISWQRQTVPGDEYLTANAVVYINNAEIETQVQNGNKFFTGTDGLGSHSRVYIENPALREYLGFDNKSENRTQFILDDDRCAKLLEYKTFSVFEKHLQEDVVTNQEKAKIMNYARKTKLNDYEKIKALESWCEMNFNT